VTEQTYAVPAASDACVYRYILNFVSLLRSSIVSEDWHLVTTSLTVWSIALRVQHLGTFERRCWLEYLGIRRGSDGRSEKTTEQKASCLNFVHNTMKLTGLKRKRQAPYGEHNVEECTCKHCCSDYTLITNLMHWLLFILKILFFSTCFEHQALIFRRT